MNKKIFLGLGIISTIIFSCKTAYSYPHPYPLVTGDSMRRFNVNYNQHGATLNSGNLKIYLGKSCDAYSPYYGHGSWGQANGGIAVFFPGKIIGFPKQEIFIPNCPI